MHGEDIPVLVTVHNQRAGWPRGLEDLAPSGAALLVACSRAVEEDLKWARIGVPVRTVWNGIEQGAFRATPSRRNEGKTLRRKLGIEPGDFILLALANPRMQKRLDLLPAVLRATREALAGQGVRARPGWSSWERRHRPAPMRSGAWSRRVPRCVD